MEHASNKSGNLVLEGNDCWAILLKHFREEGSGRTLDLIQSVNERPLP